MHLTIRDETANGSVTNELTLDVLDETITVRDLIRSRVYQEVDDYNRRARGGTIDYRGLVTPTDAERTLNGHRLRAPRPIDWKAQFEGVRRLRAQRLLRPGRRPSGRNARRDGHAAPRHARQLRQARPAGRRLARGKARARTRWGSAT